MIYKKFSINPIFPNCANIKVSSKKQMEMKTKGVMVTIMWLSFAGSVSNSCTDFMTSAISIRYGCAISPFLFVNLSCVLRQKE